VQLKGLTHIFCVLMSFYKAFQEDALLKKIHIKNHVPFVINLKKLALKTKHKIK